jgi:hypothetical protein
MESQAQKSKNQFPRSASAGLVALLLTALQPARAELPPWVYAEEQRRAPLRLELQVLRAVARGEQLQVRGVVLAIHRQRSPLRLRPGDTIELRYPVAPPRPGGWVGPSPIPLLQAGERVSAWLTPLPGQPGLWAPAAGGRSFGPSLEDVQDPNR